jgi:hypothetical protein
VLAAPWQIAQKLHAVTERYAARRENPRVRDLVDIQLLEATDPDIRKVRDACERVFTRPLTLFEATSSESPEPDPRSLLRMLGYLCQAGYERAIPANRDEIAR